MDPNPPAPMFREPTPPREFPTTAVAIAAVAIAILVAVLVALGRRHAAPPPNTLQPLAPYAPNLVLSDIHMSEASSMTGGKSTYIEGHVANRGPSTVTGITVQVIFANDQAMPPQLETLALPLVYMREPYVDTRPVAASPLAPAAEADFRLIFESLNDNWNQQQPEIRVIAVTSKNPAR